MNIRIHEKLQAAPPPVRDLVLELLDEMSSPMDARELDRVFMVEGFSRTEARRMVKALKHYHVIALTRQ